MIHIKQTRDPCDFPVALGGRLHPERPAGRAGARLPVALGAVDIARAVAVGEHHQWLGARIWWWYDGYTPEIYDATPQKSRYSMENPFPSLIFVGPILNLGGVEDMGGMRFQSYWEI